MNLITAKIRQMLAQQHLDAALISSAANINYLTNYSNFSTTEREAYLLLTMSKNFILTDGRYTTEVKKLVKDFAVIELSSASPFKKSIQNLISSLKINSLGIEEANLTVSEYNKIRDLLPHIRNFQTQTLRIIKSRTEIEKINNACKIGDQAFNFILQHLKQGVSEREIAYLLENFMRGKGAEPSFNTIVAFSQNSAVPHHQTNDTKLKEQDIALLDFGVKADNYCSDMTRTVFVGNASEEQKNVYQTVLNAQNEAIKFLKSKFVNQNSDTKFPLTSGVDNASRGYILSKGFASIPHSLGHGIGRQVHEPPSLSPASNQILSEGMVFSIEPGIYLPGKFGIRIEDIFVLEEKLIQLTSSPKELIII